MIDRLETIIFYFEGSCEICLANKGIDSYRAEVNELINSDRDLGSEVNLRLYYAHALIEYKTGNIEAALAGWLMARDYAELTGDKLYLAKTYSFLAICYYVNGNLEQEARCFFGLAEDIFKEQQNFGELASHYINMLWFKRYERDKTEIIDYLDKAFSYVQMSGSMKNARIYLHLGYIYKTIFSDYAKCIGYLVKSNELCREFGFTEMESMTFHVLADVYSKIDKPAETIRIYKDVLDNDKFKNITPNLKAAILCNLSACYIKMRDLANAEDYLLKLGTILPDVQTSIKEQYRALMLGLKAEYLNLKGGANKYALELISEAERIFQKYSKDFIVYEFPYMIASCKGDIYMALGDYKKALESYDEMEKLASSIDLHEQKTACEKLACAYEASGDYKRSLEYYKKADGVSSEISRVNQDIQYESLYKEFIRQIKEQEKKNLEKLNSTLEQQGNIDALTGVYNRNYLNRYMETAAASLANGALSILMIDIDSLKIYNDIHGHIRGDNAIKKIADVLKKRCRATDRLIRYGGDEFIVILEGTAGGDATSMAQELIENIKSLEIDYEYFNIKGTVTASIGIASRPQGAALDLEAMIKEADRAMYHSKSAGKAVATHSDLLCV